jgi:hypothetical protein
MTIPVPIVVNGRTMCRKATPAGVAAITDFFLINTQVLNPRSLNGYCLIILSVKLLFA